MSLSPHLAPDGYVLVLKTPDLHARRVISTPPPPHLAPDGYVLVLKTVDPYAPRHLYAPSQRTSSPRARRTPSRAHRVAAREQPVHMQHAAAALFAIQPISFAIHAAYYGKDLHR